jgi:hypothetical protein
MSIFDLSMCDAQASEQRSYRDIDPGTAVLATDGFCERL